ncbi:hypothetical protein CcCBS67573_g05967 [Chytriomyces confervae]|uniref:SHSP domain-containing protein n=1 Tax=Chytriomyces confervae TaxID=246404 RepID=A0A507F8U4_9FUNG|nr:hypothetical protein HDU80_009462 [Chytriomyces hyalinus]TPX72020.1 hypothetical protein CcCBS67573_g05967 [Chytriomyces confervae]
MAIYFKRDPIFSEFDHLLNAHLNSLTSNNDTEAVDSNNSANQNKVSKYWGGSFNARLDLIETPSSYLVHADLPGIPKEQVQISVKDDILTLSGERSQQREEKDEHRHIVERSQGKFSRSLRLPRDANVEDVKATMEHGVLELVVGKKVKEDGAKKITIQ